MHIELPAIPVGMLTLLAFFSPYAVAVINAKRWSASSKRLMSIAVSVALALVVMVVYYVMTGDAIPDWPILVLLALLVQQAAYALVLKPTAAVVEASVGSK